MRRSRSIARAGIPCPTVPFSSRLSIYNRRGSFQSENSFSHKSERAASAISSALRATAKNGPVHLYQVSPSINASYGLTNHVELGAAISMNSFWATQNGQSTSSTGLGDTSLIMKYRPIIQDPGSWRPSLTYYTQLVLPTSRWADAEKPPGGFSPLGRLPATRFGEFGLTQGLMTRKILQPFRISAAVFYTYAAPGENNGMNTYTGDVVNTRLIFEHILDDKTRVRVQHRDQHLARAHLAGRWTRHQRRAKNGFTIIGVGPALQWNFSQNWLVAVGCEFTVAGQNAINAIYPSLSVFWMWDKSGKIVMR